MNSYSGVLKTIFCAMLFVGCQTLYSQTEKGRLLIGLTTTVTDNGISQVGYQTEKRKGDGFESDTEKSLSLNFSPKVGYFLWPNLAVGIEGNLNLLSVKDDSFLGDDIKGTVILGGPFVRYYYGVKNVRPFAEISGLIGRSTFTFDDPNNDDFDNTFKSDILSFGGGVGIAAQLGNKVSFDTILIYNRFTDKETVDNPENERTIVTRLGIRVGVSLYL